MIRSPPSATRWNTRRLDGCRRRGVAFCGVRSPNADSGPHCRADSNTTSSGRRIESSQHIAQCTPVIWAPATAKTRTNLLFSKTCIGCIGCFECREFTGADAALISDKALPRRRRFVAASAWQRLELPLWQRRPVSVRTHLAAGEAASAAQPPANRAARLGRVARAVGFPVRPSFSRHQSCTLLASAARGRRAVHSPREATTGFTYRYILVIRERDR